MTFDGLIITANSSMNTTSASGLNYTITFSAASTSGIASWDVPINIRLAKPHMALLHIVCFITNVLTVSMHINAYKIEVNV